MNPDDLENFLEQTTLTVEEVVMLIQNGVDADVIAAYLDRAGKTIH